MSPPTLPPRKIGSPSIKSKLYKIRGNVGPISPDHADERSQILFIILIVIVLVIARFASPDS